VIDLMPDKFGNTFDSDMLKSPLTVGRPGREPGPDVNNNPVARPEDPMRYIPSNSRTAKNKK
jgi:hypothetical protein